MKTVRLLSIFLVLILAISCSFVGCGKDNKKNTSLPQDDYYNTFYDLTYSFQIKNSDGRIMVEAIDYNYKGHDEPTILNIISDYLETEAEFICKVDKNNFLVQVGNVKAKKDQYWAFAPGIDYTISELTGGVLDKTKTLSLSTYNCVENECTSFTVILTDLPT